VLASAALLNGGFEAEVPHVLLPRRAYAHLFSKEPAGSHIDQVQTAGGAASVVTLSEAIEAWVDGGDRSSPIVPVLVLVSDAETEVLVSDTAIDAFGIEITSHGRGLWRFAGDARTRSSVPPQLW
jgi:hypothetical protein